MSGWEACAISFGDQSLLHRRLGLYLTPPFRHDLSEKFRHATPLQHWTLPHSPNPGQHHHCVALSRTALGHHIRHRSEGHNIDSTRLSISALNLRFAHIRVSISLTPAPAAQKLALTSLKCVVLLKALLVSSGLSSQ